MRSLWRIFTQAVGETFSCLRFAEPYTPPCHKLCFYLKTVDLASRMVKSSDTLYCREHILRWGGGDRTTKFHFNSIFMADHIFPSAPIKASQNLSVLARLCASNTLPQDQYALGAFGIDCWKKFSGKVWIQFYWLFAGLPVYMCDYYALQKYK